MDLVAIEHNSFDAFKKHLKHIINLTEGLSSSNLIPIEQEWIEGKELATSLNVSLRALQTLREYGKLSFSTIGKKIYYRIAEVKSLLDENKINLK